jgi:hypothetical protein
MISTMTKPAPTQMLLEEVADPLMNRKDVAHTYSRAIKTDLDTTDWLAVNRAIMDRWGVAGLLFIKRRAWGLVTKSR